MTHRLKLACLFMLMFCMLLYPRIIFAESVDIFDYDKGSAYSSSDYYRIAQELVAAYPEILHFETIGFSRDKNPIYAITMTENVREAIARDDFSLYRTHYYVEAGTHGRETVNTPIVIKIIEDYAKDYYDDNYIAEFNLKEELGKAAIHFIPLVNPDGFDLVKFGTGSVNTQAATTLLSAVAKTNFSDYKANIAGVDLNRNFPDEYYDTITMKWINKFQVYRGSIPSDDPSNGYYAGPYGGSEPETAAVMDYVLRYDFRNFLSFHSRGKYIDCGKYWFGADYNKRAFELAMALHDVNHYRVDSYSSGKESGFLSDYAVAQTLKPVVTIETTLGDLPTHQSLYKEAYAENYLLPLYAVRQGNTSGYLKYRLYVDRTYVRDFSEYIYAKAHADRYEESTIVAGTGIPEMTLNEALMNGCIDVGFPGKFPDIQEHWAKETIERLIDKDAINGYKDATFKPDNTITRAEFLKLALTSTATDRHIVTKATTGSMNEHWASGIFEAAIERGILNKGEMPKASWDRPITRYEMIMILTRLAEKTLGEPTVNTAGVESMIFDYNLVLQNKAYAYYVEQAYRKGMVAGIDDAGTFAGDHTGTRAEAATMVLALIDTSARKQKDNDGY